MVELKYIPIASIVYAIQLNTIEEFELKDINIKVSNDGESNISYSLKNLSNNCNTTLSSKQVFATIEELQDNIQNQIEALNKKKEACDREQEKKEETFS